MLTIILSNYHHHLHHMIIWSYSSFPSYDHIDHIYVTSGIFGPLSLTSLFFSALQKPESEERVFWSQRWKHLCDHTLKDRPGAHCAFFYYWYLDFPFDHPFLNQHDREISYSKGSLSPQIRMIFYFFQTGGGGGVKPTFLRMDQHSPSPLSWGAK